MKFEIVDYTIVVGKGVRGLEERVRYYMTLGLQPIGGAIQDSEMEGWWRQTMVKYG